MPTTRSPVASAVPVFVHQQATTMHSPRKRSPLGPRPGRRPQSRWCSRDGRLMMTNHALGSTLWLCCMRKLLSHARHLMKRTHTKYLHHALPIADSVNIYGHAKHRRHWHGCCKTRNCKAPITTFGETCRLYMTAMPILP